MGARTYTHKLVDNVTVNDIFIFERRLVHLLQVNGKVLAVPAVLFDLAQLNALDRIRLQHASDQILAIRWDLNWHAIIPLLDLHEENCKLLVIKGQTATDHGIEDDATTPYVHLLTTV